MNSRESLLRQNAAATPVTDDRHLVFSRLLFIGGKGSSEHRLDSEQGKEIRIDLDSADAFRLALFGKVSELGF